MPHHELLVAWLGDAYGAESAAGEVLSDQLSDLTGHKELEDRVLAHFDQTQAHANMLLERIGQLGGATSSVNKGGLPTVLKLLAGSWKAGADGRLVKNNIVDATIERFEIATYLAVIAAADEMGDDATVAICRDILRDEEQMAKWLDDHLAASVREMMAAAGEDNPSDDQGGDSPIDAAGALRGHFVYGVFATPEQAGTAEEKLRRDGDNPYRLQGAATVALLRGQGGGQLAAVRAVERQLKKPTGEDSMARHYATHLENGRVILAVPAADRAGADRLSASLKQQGAFDVSYVAGLGIEQSV
jgi:ferritin-like metal-binding protein YciE